jgi:hypothetical protein
MQDAVAFASQPVHDRLVGDGFQREAETGLSGQGFDILESPGR